MEVIQKFIELNKHNKIRIAVIGDVMLDVYYYGNADRVSPEFPVPILTSHDRDGEWYPGGAANVCLQMKHFNVDSFLISFIDKEAHSLFEKQNFNTLYSVALGIGRMPRKVRFYDGDFPLHRWDIEPPNYGEDDNFLSMLRSGVLETFDVMLVKEKPDAVILSDYNKGFWTDDLAQTIIKRCSDNGIITVVDPKKELRRWRGCTIFKPNAKEAKALSGKDNVKGQIDFLQESLDCCGVVITQSGKGLVGKYDGCHFEHWTPSKLTSREVNSVIGAGDCFAAVMTIALAHGLTLKDSCALAFEGGVQYVKARHNKPITLHDIHARFDAPSAKVLTLDELVYLKDNIYQQDEFVFTNGCFDAGLTRGHIECLKFAKSQGTKLVVGINSDESVKRLKGEGRPIMTLEDRMHIMASIEYVDYVVCFEEDTPLSIIEHLKPKLVIKGGDYQPHEVVGYEQTKVMICPYYNGMSTTRKIETINSIFGVC